MNIIAKKLQVIGDSITISTNFRNFNVNRSDILSFKIGRIPSLFDEIGIEIKTDREYIVTERVNGFFELVKFFQVEEEFGSLWYRDAENGCELKKKFENTI